MNGIEVLIVEDDEAISAGLALNLKIEGCMPAAVLDGETALARLKEGRFDLVLLDISLPGITGLDVLAALRDGGDDKRITLRARTTKRKIEILVEDNGIGLEPTERRELFETFTRGKAAVDRRAPGVGLGLAIVRAIVRAHRGRIELHDNPGGGALFRVLLPRPRLHSSVQAAGAAAATQTS